MENLVSNTDSIVVEETKKFNRSRWIGRWVGGGVIGTQSLHSAMNLSHKYLSDLLQIHKEGHYLAFFRDDWDLGIYIGIKPKY